jgi:hypothetical protein
MEADYAAVVEHFCGGQQSSFLVFLCDLLDLFVMTAGNFDITERF